MPTYLNFGYISLYSPCTEKQERKFDDDEPCVSSTIKRRCFQAEWRSMKGRTLIVAAIGQSRMSDRKELPEERAGT